MQTFKQKLLKHYGWVYATWTVLIALKVFPNTHLPLLGIYFIILIELALKKQVNGQLVKDDFKGFYFLVFATIIALIIIWQLQ